MIPFYKPFLERYTKSAIEAIESNWISNHGKYIELASKELLKRIKSKYCILMNNGTSATHCLFLSLKFKHPEIKKIYVPNNVFIAPINCVLREYESSMIEVMKIDVKTLNICVEDKYIQSLDKNSAILIVHNLGNIINISRLKRLRPDIIFVEDNCEGIFGKYENYNTSSCTDVLCSSVSFYGNKTITTGEGGAFFTNDKDIYDNVIKIYSHGMTDKKYVHDSIGYNYRMTNVSGGLLYDQLMDLNFILENKKRVFETYINILKENKNIIFPFTEKETSRSYWVFFLIFKNKKYVEAEKYLSDKGIETRPIFYPISVHSHLKIKSNENKDNFFINENGIILPSYPNLTEKEISYICHSIQKFTNYD
tara:strand:+ start:2914 stop:4011 length:1098 start_codon:yes stop_codon:yes gene_type:complete